MFREANKTPEGRIVNAEGRIRTGATKIAFGLPFAVAGATLALENMTKTHQDPEFLKALGKALLDLDFPIAAFSTVFVGLATRSGVHDIAVAQTEISDALQLQHTRDALTQEIQTPTPTS